MKRFLYLACLNLALMPFSGKAQDQSDALRYSENILGGTARFASMGGAFCALGGDMSSLAYNPAGIAVFTKNQFTITPGLTFQNTGSTYNGSSASNEMQSFNIQNIGIVGTWKTKKEDNMWKSYSFGITYNRMNNFNTNVTINGYTTKSSFLDNLTEYANGGGANDAFLTQPADSSGLLYTYPGTNTPFYNIVDPNLNGTNELQQTETIGTTGSMGETDISFGGNYNDKLFIGATFGIVDINYNENINFTETPVYYDTIFGLSSYSFSSQLSTSGVGYNFKLGFIYRIMDWLRIGGAVHSPTMFSMSDDYNTTFTTTFINSDYVSAGQYGASSPQGSYNYNLTTPWKAMGGIAAVIDNQGILSAEYEYVDYSSARFNSSDGLLSPVNTTISDNFMPASNLRFGAEWVLYPVSFRIGYGIYGNPYQSVAGNSVIRNTYSAGIGLKINNVFIDLAYTLMMYNENYYMYTLSDQSLVYPVVNKTNVSNVMLTFGVNFDHQKKRAARHERFRAYPPPPPPPPPPGE